MKQEKRVYYEKCADGGYDVVVNVNGHDVGNYHYSDLKYVLKDFDGAEFIEVNNDEQ